MTTSLMRGLPRRDTCCHATLTRVLEPSTLPTGTSRSALAYTPTTDDVLLASVGKTPFRVSCDLGTWIAIACVL